MNTRLVEEGADIDILVRGGAQIFTASIGELAGSILWTKISIKLFRMEERMNGSPFSYVYPLSIKCSCAHLCTRRPTLSMQGTCILDSQSRWKRERERERERGRKKSYF